VEADSAIGRDADLPPECCLLTMTEEPMELYESSRSSQLSSPRSSSDSVETTSSCTTSCSSTRAKAAALSLRSLPIPEEVKQPLFPLTIPPSSQDGSVTDLLFKGSPLSPQKNSVGFQHFFSLARFLFNFLVTYFTAGDGTQHVESFTRPWCSSCAGEKSSQ